MRFQVDDKNVADISNREMKVIQQVGFGPVQQRNIAKAVLVGGNGPELPQHHFVQIGF